MSKLNRPPGPNRPPGASRPSGPRKPPSQSASGKQRVPTPAPQPASPLKAAARISPARVAAFEILERVATTTDHSDDLLHGRRLAGLSQADRNLATTLVMGVLRWQIALDAQIRPFLQRPDLALASPVATALRLGAFQLLHLDRIPAHAALSESVELVRAANQPHATGMVNAVLRKVAAAPATKPKLYESTAAFAERLGHPAWLAERWVRNYGRAAALAVCEYDQHEPPAGGLFAASQPGGLFATPQLGGLFAASPPGDPFVAPQPRDLVAALQLVDEAAPEHAPLPRLDDGSRLVAELAAATHPHPARIWDACAAPGGKTLILAHRHPQADLLATDINPRRLQSLTERLVRDLPGGRTRTVQADAVNLAGDEGLFDLILCDVPCSGTGTLARNPEIRHHLQPADLSRQARRQREILTAALARLAPGGRLLYSTCSLEPEENEALVAEVLAVLPSGQIAPLSLEPAFESLQQSGILRAKPQPNLLRDGHLRTLPGSGFQGDGFFAAAFQRG